MKDTKSNERQLFSIHDPQGVKLLSQLRLNFSHLNKDQFRHDFKDCVNPMCGFRLKIESAQHLLPLSFCHVERSKLLNSLYDIDLAINELNESTIINLILFGSDKYHIEINRKRLLNCITYIKATARFNEPLL